MAFHEQIKAFIINNFLFGDAGELTDATSLLDAGIIDSTGILEIVQFVEETFKIIIDDEELLPENLDSVDSIATFVARKKQIVESAVE
jgi:acyl carrier protein